jgi:hypothetical protein
MSTIDESAGEGPEVDVRPTVAALRMRDGTARVGLAFETGEESVTVILRPDDALRVCRDIMKAYIEAGKLEDN